MVQITEMEGAIKMMRAAAYTAQMADMANVLCMEKEWNYIATACIYDQLAKTLDIFREMTEDTAAKFHQKACGAAAERKAAKKAQEE